MCARLKTAPSSLSMAACATIRTAGARFIWITKPTNPWRWAKSAKSPSKSTRNSRFTSSPSPTALGGSKSARPACLSPSVPPTGRPHSTLAALRSTRSSAPFRSGRRNILRMAPFGPTAKCLQPRWRHARRNLHLSESMSSTPPCARAAAALFLAALFVAGNALAQDKPDRPPWAQPKPKLPANSSSADAAAPVPPALPTPPPPGSIVPTPEQPLRPPDGADPQRAKIKVKVELVNILASVLDDHSRPAPDLPIEAFQVYEEGVAQKIEVFESETKLPLDLALMIDSSMSANMEIAFEKEAAAHFIHQVLRPGDSLSVFGFDENVTQLTAFSDNVSTLQAAVRKIPPGAGTSIYDAVLLGARALEHRGGERRRVIILVTDAGETTSRADFDG